MLYYTINNGKIIYFGKEFCSANIYAERRNMEKRGYFKVNNRTRKLVQLALLTAIIIIMLVTPLGFLTIGPVSLTFISIPVAVGAVILGPLEGMFLGLIFGIVSYIKAIMGDPFGALLLSINPFFTLILCIVPRTLMGLLTGLTFRGLRKIIKFDIIPYSISACGAAVYNTALFIPTLGILFRGYENDLYGSTFWAFLKVILLTNALPEAIVALVAGGAICYAVARFQKTSRIGDIM